MKAPTRSITRLKLKYPDALVQLSRLRPPAVRDIHAYNSGPPLLAPLRSCLPHNNNDIFVGFKYRDGPSAVVSVGYGLLNYRFYTKVLQTLPR